MWHYIWFFLYMSHSGQNILERLNTLFTLWLIHSLCEPQTTRWPSQANSLTCSSSSREILSSLSRSYRRKATGGEKKKVKSETWGNLMNVHDTDQQLHPNTSVRQCSTLTEQLVCPAVEWLRRWGVLVLLIVFDWSEMSQGSHETPEVHLVLS